MLLLFVWDARVWRALVLHVFFFAEGVCLKFLCQQNNKINKMQDLQKYGVLLISLFRISTLQVFVLKKNQKT